MEKRKLSRASPKATLLPFVLAYLPLVASLRADQVVESITGARSRTETYISSNTTEKRSAVPSSPWR